MPTAHSFLWAFMGVKTELCHWMQDQIINFLINSEYWSVYTALRMIAECVTVQSTIIFHQTRCRQSEQATSGIQNVRSKVSLVVIKTQNVGDGKTAQQLETLAVLIEDLALVPSIYMAAPVPVVADLCRHQTHRDMHVDTELMKMHACMCAFHTHADTHTYAHKHMHIYTCTHTSTDMHTLFFLGKGSLLEQFIRYSVDPSINDCLTLERSTIQLLLLSAQG